MSQRVPETLPSTRDVEKVAVESVPTVGGEKAHGCLTIRRQFHRGYASCSGRRTVRPFLGTRISIYGIFGV